MITTTINNADAFAATENGFAQENAQLEIISRDAQTAGDTAEAFIKFTAENGDTHVMRTTVADLVAQLYPLVSYYRG